MSIQFACPCGKKINAKDEHAGKKGKCPQCGGVVTVPMLASAGVGAGIATGAAKPRQAAPPPPPADDDMYDVKEDAAPPRTRDEGIGFSEAITPMPYNPTARPGAQPAGNAVRPGSAPVPGAASVPGAFGRRAKPEQEKGGKLSRMNISGTTIFLVALLVVVPVAIFVIKQGPVNAIAEWEKAEPNGENDVRSAMGYIIAKMDEATMPPPDPNEDSSGIPYAPQVEEFTYIHPPTIMWKMPDTVPYRGRTTFGPYSGDYYTRKREVIGEMQWKNGDMLKVVCKCDEQGNVATLTVDGIDINNTAAVKKKWD